MAMRNYIRLEDCEDGCLYRLRSRNLAIGVFSQEMRGFVGIREKFGAKFLELEYGYTQEPSFGSATAVQKLEKCPIGELKSYSNPELFSWLMQKEQQYLRPVRLDRLGQRPLKP